MAKLYAELGEFCKRFEAKGFKLKRIIESKQTDVDEKSFIQGIRSRYKSFFEKFSDEELEKGIAELEEKNKDYPGIIKLDSRNEVIVITKN